MVVIGSGRGEAPVTARADGTTSGRRIWNPPTAVFARNMNHEIRLHLTAVIAARALELGNIGAGGSGSGGVRLEHMLLEAALLNETLRTHTAEMRHLSGVFLHVVVHGVLARLGYAAVRADELALLVTDIGHLGGNNGHLD